MKRRFYFASQFMMKMVNDAQLAEAAKKAKLQKLRE